jgi:hypothetical protein
MDSSKLAGVGITMTEVRESIRQSLRHWQKAAA